MKSRQRFSSPALRAAIAEQRRANRSTRAERERFASHREHVMRLVAEHSGDALCVLGPGNCNDLDLPRLAEWFAEIHLIDLDVQAVGAAVATLPVRDAKRVRIHAPLDVAGSIEWLPRWKRMQATAESLLAHPRQVASTLQRAVNRRFDCVLSCGLLTQLQLMVVHGLGDQHPLFAAVSQTTLLTHLRVLEALSQPSGSALLVTELDAVAAATPASDASPLLQEYVARDLGFSISRPGLLLSTLADDPVLARAFEVKPPDRSWLWHQGPLQSYLVYALELQRHGAGCRGGR